MIHHISIPANHPQNVASVLAKIWGGEVAPFPPHPGSYVAMANDEHGTMIEVHPRTTELIPGDDQQETQFQENSHPSQFYGIHAAISVPATQKQIEEIAAHEGWRVLYCNRGNFEVIEFWIENHFMLELLTPEMASQYLNFAQKQNLDKFLTVGKGV